MQDQQQPEVSKKKELAIIAKQREFFGERYAGATLANVRFTNGDCGAEALGDYILAPSKICVLSGPPGVGKTYICAAMLGFLPEGMFVRAYSERDLLTKVRKSIGDGVGDYLDNMRYLIDDDFIILDDLGSSGANDWRREVLFEFVDYRYNLSKPTVITTNLTKAEIKENYGARMASRLFASENAVIDLFDSADLRTMGY